MLAETGHQGHTPISMSRGELWLSIFANSSAAVAQRVSQCQIKLWLFGSKKHDNPGREADAELSSLTGEKSCQKRPLKTHNNC